MFVFGHFLLIYQQGAQSTSKVLIFKRPKSLEVMLSGYMCRFKSGYQGMSGAWEENQRVVAK
jgi:hypothetical protein